MYLLVPMPSLRLSCFAAVFCSSYVYFLCHSFILCFFFNDTATTEIFPLSLHVSFLFFFNDTATTEIYTLSLHDALPISLRCTAGQRFFRPRIRSRKYSNGKSGCRPPTIWNSVAPSRMPCSARW